MSSNIQVSLTQEFFEQRLSRQFSVNLPAGNSQLELIEVKGLPACAGSPNQEPFSLLFRGPIDFSFFSQQMVVLEGDQDDRISLFLTRVVGDHLGSYFEAVFN